MIEFQVVPPCGGHLTRYLIVFQLVETFQVVPPCGGHHHAHRPRSNNNFVSSRAPVWGASKEDHTCKELFKFQVVPPCGGHPSGFFPEGELVQFQVVPPCGGHHTSKRSSQRGNSFKSCPRVGGIRAGGKRKKHNIVSSRAPVWGASRYTPCANYHGHVSSRAPVWGASSLKTRKLGCNSMFQVVPPCGGHLDHIVNIMLFPLFQVVPPCGGHPFRVSSGFWDLWFQVVPPCGGHQRSIHNRSGNCGVSSRAPVWGASVQLGCYTFFLYCCFKSCPRVGGIGFVSFPYT